MYLFNDSRRNYFRKCPVDVSCVYRNKSFKKLFACGITEQHCMLSSSGCGTCVPDAGVLSAEMHPRTADWI